jgi:signal transduction histidine kinase
MFIFNRIVRSAEKDPVIYVPAIVTDSTGQRPIMNNLDFPEDLKPSEKQQYLAEELERIKARSDYKPLRVELPEGGYQLIYYRETDELIQLRYYPFVILLVTTLLLGLAFLNIYVSQRSQLNKVWAGLAKETAHQLGSPISALLGWIQLLRANAEGQPEQQEVIDELEKDVSQLDKIANRFSKIGSAPELEYADLRASLERSIAYLRKRSSKNVNITLHYRLETGEAPAFSPPLFEWVIENLVKNALDASAKNVTLYVFSRRKGFVIDIEDDGKGFAYNKRKEIFKPGYTTKKRGWGLGLSLAKRIIESYHRGKIFVRFTAPGQGTSFRITLPRR